MKLFSKSNSQSAVLVKKNFFFEYFKNLQFNLTILKIS